MNDSRRIELESSIRAQPSPKRIGRKVATWFLAAFIATVMIAWFGFLGWGIVSFFSPRVSVDWNSVFVPAIGLAEIVVRGSLMYLGLFMIMRFMARRQAGHFGPADLLVIVLIADAAQNGLGKEYGSVTEGLALVLTIVAWEYLLDWVAWRFPATRPYLKPPSLTLIRDGRLLPQNLRKEMITEDELKSQLRGQSVEDYGEIKLATLEGDGRLSVIKQK